MGFASGFQAGLSAVKTAKEMRDERMLRDELANLENEYTQTQQTYEQAEETAGLTGAPLQSAAPVQAGMQSPANAALGLGGPAPAMSPVAKQPTMADQALGLKPEPVTIDADAAPRMSMQKKRERQAALYRQFGDPKMAMAIEEAIASDEDRRLQREFLEKQFRETARRAKETYELQEKQFNVTKTAADNAENRAARQEAVTQGTDALTNLILANANSVEVETFVEQLPKDVRESVKTNAYTRVAQDLGSTYTEISNIGRSAISDVDELMGYPEDRKLSAANQLLESSFDPDPFDETVPVIAQGKDEKGTYTVIKYGEEERGGRFYDDEFSGVLKAENQASGLDKLLASTKQMISANPVGFGLDAVQTRNEAKKAAEGLKFVRDYQIDLSNYTANQKKTYLNTLNAFMDNIGGVVGFDPTNPAQVNKLNTALAAANLPLFNAPSTGIGNPAGTGAPTGTGTPTGPDLPDWSTLSPSPM